MFVAMLLFVVVAKPLTLIKKLKIDGQGKCLIATSWKLFVNSIANVCTPLHYCAKTINRSYRCCTHAHGDTDSGMIWHDTLTHNEFQKVYKK